MSIFNQVYVPKIKLNSFDLSHDVKLTTQFSRLTPVGCFEVNPGETHQISTNMFLRLMPTLAPVMHEINAYIHWFFVPNRLIWDKWEDFITGGAEGTDDTFSPSFYVPSGTASTLNNSVFKNSSLADYLGFPKLNTNNSFSGDVEYQRFSLLPFLAYQKIYNEYYRDQNLEDEIDISFNDASTINITPSARMPLFELRYRAWEKDYFTSSLPWTQRGEAAGLSIVGEAPVVYDKGNAADWKLRSAIDGGSPIDGYLVSDNYSLTITPSPTVQGSGMKASLDPNGTLKADLSNISPVTINQLRIAYSLQRWLEASAVGGSRYIEQILTHFGVKSSDARLQRPEYLGGNRVPVMISEVLQNSATTEDSPQGNMAGHGVSSLNDFSFKRYFEEHGFIVGILSVMPRTAYQQGVNRMWLREDRFDYFFPEFAELGEQEVKSQEIYGNIFRTQGSQVFGYQSRYAEYKHQQGRVAGAFKDSLNYWHLGRIFDTTPVLNNDFVKPDTEVLNRIFNVTDNNQDNILCEIYLDYKALRPMPYFGKPAW